MDETTNRRKTAWIIMISAAAILMITMGARQSLGLFINPLDTATGLGIVSISFALAIGQLIWGIVQPVFGAIADKKGTYYVLVFGALVLAGGTALTPFVQSEWALMVTIGILRRPSQILCKPPLWCRLEAPQWRLNYGKKESHPGGK